MPNGHMRSCPGRAAPRSCSYEGPEDVAAQASPVEPFFQPQDALNGGASSPGKRCHRCHMCRAMRGHFDEPSWNLREVVTVSRLAKTRSWRPERQCPGS
jgi:hypothetical protein